MKHQYHFGSPNYAVLKEVAAVSALISDLDRTVLLLENDIATEEERAGVSDPFNTAYPIVARMMTATPGQSERNHRRARTATFVPNRGG